MLGTMVLEHVKFFKCLRFFRLLVQASYLDQKKRQPKGAKDKKLLTEFSSVQSLCNTDGFRKNVWDNKQCKTAAESTFRLKEKKKPFSNVI